MATTISAVLAYARAEWRSDEVACIFAPASSALYVQTRVTTRGSGVVYGEAIDLGRLWCRPSRRFPTADLRNQGWHAPRWFRRSPNFQSRGTSRRPRSTDVGQDLASALRIVSGMPVTEDLVVEILVPQRLPFWRHVDELCA